MEHENQNFIDAVVTVLDQNFDVRLFSDAHEIKELLEEWQADHQNELCPDPVRWELLALDIRPVRREDRQDHPEDRFRPIFTSSNNDTNPPTLDMYPDVPALLSNEEAITYYKKRQQETTNPIRRSRYADLVWTSMQKQRNQDFYPQGLETARAYLNRTTEHWHSPKH